MAFGTYKEVVSARATDKAIQKVAQDGGIVSALLCYALEENIIEGAIVAGDTEDAWKPEPTIAMTPEEIIADINSKKPDVLFVCLGVPKQEKWIYEHKNDLEVKVMMGLGGSLDVIAGEAKRAPEIFQKLNMEWFYRLCKEPWRIGRMMDLPKFAMTVILKGKRAK